MKRDYAIVAMLVLATLVFCWRVKRPAPTTEAGLANREAGSVTVALPTPGGSRQANLPERAGTPAREGAPAQNVSPSLAGSWASVSSGQPANLPVADRSPAAQPKSGHAQPQISPEAAYLATIPPVEAVVLQEEENGQVIYRADPSVLRQENFDQVLQDTMQGPAGTVTSDLITLFLSEPNPENKLAILSASTLLDFDANAQQLCEMAIGAGQPQNLRISALAYLARGGPSALSPYVNDPDPAVSLEAQSAYENYSVPRPTTVLTSPTPSAPLPVARPPDSINQSRAQ